MEATFDETDVEQLCDRGDLKFESKHYERAIANYGRALKLGEAQMPLDIRIEVRMTLAVCHLHLKSYQHAAKYDRATLEILESSVNYGSSHQHTIRTRYNLARALAKVPKSDQGSGESWQEAVVLYRKNLVAAQASERDLFVKTRKSLASVLAKLCQYQEAKQIYENILDEGETRFLEENDDESLELQHEYAAVHYHVGCHEKSKKLFQQIQATISPLPKRRKRKLRRLSQDVDRYLAACVEATCDLDMGVTRLQDTDQKSVRPVGLSESKSVAVLPARFDSLMVHDKPSTTANALHQPSPADDLLSKKTGGPEHPPELGEEDSADVTPQCHAASPDGVYPPGSSQSDASCAEKDSSKTPPSHLAEPSTSTPTLSVTLDTTSTTPDWPISLSRDALLSNDPAARSVSVDPPSEHPSDPGARETSAVASPCPISSQSPSQSVRPSDLESRSSQSPSTPTKFTVPCASDLISLRSQLRSTNLTGPESRPKPVASPPSPAPTIFEKVSSPKEVLGDNPQSPRANTPIRNRSFSAPSPYGSSSVKVVAVDTSPKQPSHLSLSQIKTPQMPQMPCVPQAKSQLPGSWPEDSPWPPDNVQEIRGPTPPMSEDEHHFADMNTGYSVSEVPEPTRVDSPSSASSENGRPFDLTLGANDADKWFYQLRYHTHRLLYDEEPKNDGRQPVRVAILDSGLADKHDHAKVPISREGCRKIKNGKVTYKDFAGGSPSRTDSSGTFHGTWCASFLMQVAPHAELYIANVVQPDRAGQKAEHVAAAIAWSIEQQVNIISMSFGWESEQPEVDEQINLARQKGIHIFAAASNDGDFTPDHGVYPASHHEVHSIYSCRGSGRSSDFNPRFTRDGLNFMFPGEDLTILEADNTPVKGIGRQKGTSFATPIAAGTAAMVLDLVRHELKNSEDIERRLRKYKGMSNIFRAMSGDLRDGGYYHVRPWTLLGERRPIASAHMVNETHKWFTLMRALDNLREFGPFSPLS